MTKVWTVEREKEQLPPRLVVKNLGLGPGQGNTAMRRRDPKAGAGLADPIGRIARLVASDAAIYKRRLDQRITRYGQAKRIFRQQGHKLFAAKVDDGRVAVSGHPVRAHAVRVGPLSLALDCDLNIAAAAVAGDVGFVTDCIRQQDRGIVQPRAPRQTEQIKGKKDIGQIQQDHGRHRERGDLFTLNVAGGAGLQQAQIGNGHSAAPLVKRLRTTDDS